MDAGYFIIAILGCADSSALCTPAASGQGRYGSEAACSAATEQVLLDNSGLEFPRLLAECRSVAGPASAAAEQPSPAPAGALRG